MSEDASELTAELEDESITQKNSLVGRLVVPSYAEWLAACNKNRSDEAKAWSD